MRARLGLLLLTLALLLPVAAPADEPAPLCPAGVESTGERAKAELRAEIVGLVDRAAAEGALADAEAFALKARIAAFGAKEDAAAAVFDAAPVTDSAALAEARDKFIALRALSNYYGDCDGLAGDALTSRLRRIVSEKHHALGYDGARRFLFSKLDNAGGKVMCVYTARWVATNDIPSASGSQSMNTEHTWPKSLGAGSDPAKCDLHHLYPTDTYANSVRSSYPFGVVDTQNAEWAQGGSFFNGDTFMPRTEHRGNVARAYFYFSVRYGKPIKDDEERTLRAWHKADPVDDADRTRNERIFGAQANRNPFIDHPEFVDKIANF